MAKNHSLPSILGIFCNAILIDWVILGFAVYGHFVLIWSFGKVGGILVAIGAVLLVGSGLSVGEVRQNFGILPLFGPLQHLTTQKEIDGIDPTSGFFPRNAFTLYVGLAGLVTLLLGVFILTRLPA